MNKNTKNKIERSRKKILSSLKVNMATLDGTQLEKSILVDIEVSGVKQESGWTGVSRLLEDKYFGSVILEEDDYGLYDGGVIFVSELINVMINGNPAILVEERGPDNKPYTILHWANSQKSFTLKVTISSKSEKVRNKIIELAESLS